MSQPAKKQPEPLTEKEVAYFTERHHEEVFCSSCKEWTSFGESCCGMTQCEDACPVCIEVYGDYL